MDEFSFIFELFALLLGLAVAEMLRGFGQVLKLRARRKAGLHDPDDPASMRAAAVSEGGGPDSGSEAGSQVRPAARQGTKIGWLVPLLGLLVLVDLATFWTMMWVARALLNMTMLTVFAVLLLIGGYYLVATQVFPDEPQLWPDFDAYYWLQKRFVVLGVVLINVVAQGALFLLQPAVEATPELTAAVTPAFLAATVLIFLNLPALLWLAFSRRKRVDIALIAFVVATQFFYAWAAMGVEGVG